MAILAKGAGMTAESTRLTLKHLKRSARKVRRKSLRFLPIALVVIVVAALVWRLAHPPSTNVASEMVGKAVPQFSAAAALPGTLALTSADLADGKPKLVNFFASWCVPCIAEAPVLTELRNQGVPIVGIAVRDRPQDLAQFLSDNGNPFQRIGSDPRSGIQLAFGSGGVPETFLVDGRGVIRMQHIGPIQSDEVRDIVGEVKAAK
jgi:cytochrome c biogenesis protein CcmG/thiol:disulfide interchange protein DsbE